MLWDEEYLYIFAQKEEPHVWATLTRHDDIIYRNNDFEIFIDPDGNTHQYYEVEVNAFNTVFDLFLDKPYRRGGRAHTTWTLHGLKTAVAVQGTLNDASDIDDGWSVELAIPWSIDRNEDSLRSYAPENEFWRINFSRVNWDFELTGTNYARKKDSTENYLDEYNWVWSPQWRSICTYQNIGDMSIFHRLHLVAPAALPHRRMNR